MSGRDCPLLSRFAPRAGLVTLRQTFVRRCHLGWTPSEPPRRDAHHKTEFPDVAVSLVVRLACDDRANVDCEGRAKLILDSRRPSGRDFATGRLGFVTDLLPPQPLMSPRPRTPEQRASSDQARRNPDTLTFCDALDLLLKPPVTKISETLTPIKGRRRPLHIPSRTQTPSAHPR
jgi:hypothetical protein